MEIKCPQCSARLNHLLENPGSYLTRIVSSCNCGYTTETTVHLTETDTRELEPQPKAALAAMPVVEPPKETPVEIRLTVKVNGETVYE